MKYLLFSVLFLFIFSGCGDDTTSTPVTNVCDPICESWQNCVDKVCVLKTGFCETNTNCQDDEICNEEHECEEFLEDVCKDITCSNHGSCVAVNGVAKCNCDGGYKEAANFTCVTLCTDVECTGDRVCNPADGECVCQNGAYFNELTQKCEADEDCDGVTCDSNSYCLLGECYLKDECSVENPDGVCPSIDGITLTCKDGICISTNDGTVKETERCMPSEFDCEEGTICADVFKDGFYKCRAFCDMTQEGSCGEKGICLPYLDDILLNTGICVKEDVECQPNATEVCPENWVCDLMITAKVCRPVGQGKYGDDCDNMDSTSALDACEVGLFCVGDDDDGEPYKCQELCSPLAQTDDCEVGRCIALEDVSPAVLNREIGMCIDAPMLCNAEEGIKNNPVCEGTNSTCFPYETDTAVCDADECSPSTNSCENGLGCTRTLTSNYHCLKEGNLDFGARNCINPQYYEGTEPLTEDNLCKEGLYCVGDEGQTVCQKLCDPNVDTDVCGLGGNYRCADLHELNAQIPAGINGICTDLPSSCDTTAGYENNPACGGDESICFPINQTGTGVCDSDLCEIDSDTCGEGMGCTRSITSKNHCLLIGNLTKGSGGCVNAEYTLPENLVPEKLCQEGLYCIGQEGQEKCSELCNPDVATSCTMGGICTDLHTFANQIPAGINGICLP